jgi:hypothetical protein
MLGRALLPLRRLDSRRVTWVDEIQNQNAVQIEALVSFL